VQKYADDTAESLIRVQEEGSTWTSIGGSPSGVEEALFDTKLTSKQSQARASWDVNRPGRDGAWVTALTPSLDPISLLHLSE
jgi:hypothetical protein